MDLYLCISASILIPPTLKYTSPWEIPRNPHRLQLFPNPLQFDNLNSGELRILAQDFHFRRFQGYSSSFGDIFGCSGVVAVRFRIWKSNTRIPLILYAPIVYFELTVIKYVHCLRISRTMDLILFNALSIELGQGQNYTLFNR